ncbi:hypothetical protein CAAN1_16S00980 [[Candida] anglica]|uniref:cAMP-independent regulatory protein pac2 n=1 Tax=[Candida] anglica TaxID=148631 RepID=A0ABP0EAH9_9ASCO
MFSHEIPQHQDLASYHGTVNNLKDAVLLIEAVRIGRLPTITRRLNGYEREYIKPHSVYVWNETECGLKRWTDGKIWSASKASGPFLVYSELNKKSDTEPKHNGLIKQSFSLNTKQNQKFHLIAYTSKDGGSYTSNIHSTSSPSASTSLAAAATTYPPSYPPSSSSSSSSSAFRSSLINSSSASTSSDTSRDTPSSDPALNCLHLSPSVYQENLLSYIYNGIPVMATLHNVIDAPPIRRYNNDDEKIVQTLNRHFHKSWPF